MSIPPPIRTGRLRRRLAISVLLVGGLSAGVLAGGAYLLVRHARLDDSANRAVAQARINLMLAHATGTRTNLAQRLAGPCNCYTLIAPHGRVPSGAVLPVPADLQTIVNQQHRMGYEREQAHGLSMLVVGVPDPSRGRDLYFLFDESRLWSDLDQLRDVLVVGWLVVLALSAAVGMLLARRLLRPIGAASEAARSLAEGLLDTRLPGGGADEFGVWAASFNSMADALQAKITELTDTRARERRFTADVAHELRTPLTALVAEVQLLTAQADRMPVEAARMTELLSRDIERLARLVDELLEVSRLDAGQVAVEPTRVAVPALVDAIASAHGWDGRVVVTPAGASVVTDRRRLERILANLIGNAIVHGGGAGRVHVESTDGGATIEVADDGPGVPPEFVPRLFDRFSKADPSRSAAGSGLGLAIAAENAALLGGRIEVSSAPTQGARFILHLPGGGTP